jgi:hypothetical protein
LCDADPEASKLLTLPNKLGDVDVVLGVSARCEQDLWGSNTRLRGLTSDFRPRARTR